MALSLDVKIFLLYISTLKIKVKVLVNFLDKIIILVEYLDYINNFLLECVAKFLKHSNSDYIIKLKKSKQLLYNLIYSLEPIKLETLKFYIKINMANSFI